MELNTYYPKAILKREELEDEWINKYNFSLQHSEKESWKLFLKEIKSHIKYGRIEVAFEGLKFIYKHKPFFLKKYKRYYLFEELAYSFEEKGDIKQAIQCLELQSKLSPESIEPYLNISSFYIVYGMEEEAIKACKKGLTKSPEDPYLISNLIIALSNIDRYECALDYLKDILKSNPKSSLFWKLKGDVYYEIENNKDAIKCYKRSLKLKEKDMEDVLYFHVEIYSAIGSCYFEEEKYIESVKYFKKVLKYNNKDVYTLLSLAQIYFYYIKNIDLALKYYQLLVEQAPDSGVGQYQLGMIYYEKGDMEKSKWHLYKARRLMPDYSPIHEAIHVLKSKTFI